MTARSLPLAEVREPRTRARRHRLLAALVGCYLLAAWVVVVLDDAAARPRWLGLHLVALGAATNAVFVWSRHFAQALLHARVGSERVANLRLVALNVSVIAVLVGVTAGAPSVAAAGGCAVLGSVGWHVAGLIAMARGHRLPGPLRRVVGFYVASGTCLVVGAGFGTALAGGWVPDDSTAQQRLHVAHAQLNLLGWIGMAVLGTLFVLWPAVLRTRMPTQALRLVPWTLAATVSGLTLLVAGVLAGSAGLAVAGGVAFGAGVLLAGVPMLLALPGQPSRSPSAWWLGAAVGWLLAGEVVDVTRIATIHNADQVLRPVVPMLAAGLIAQALVGALSFLLPVTVGGGPVGNRRMTAVLQLGWLPRLALTNIGLALAVTGSLQRIGWALTLTGLGLFLPLLGHALRPRRAP